MSGFERQFDQFGQLQNYERLGPNIIILYFLNTVVVVNLIEEEFIALHQAPLQDAAAADE